MVDKLCTHMMCNLANHVTVYYHSMLEYTYKNNPPQKRMGKMGSSVTLGSPSMQHEIKTNVQYRSHISLLTPNQTTSTNKVTFRTEDDNTFRLKELRNCMIPDYSFANVSSRYVHTGCEQ